MTGIDIKSAVYNLTRDQEWSEDETDINDLVVNWMQLVIDDMPPEALGPVIFELENIVPGEPYSLPIDFFVANSYDIVNTDSVSYFGADSLVITTDNKVIFPREIIEGHLYYTPVEQYSDVVNDIPLHPSLHSCVVYFFYANYYYQSGEGDIEEHRLADTYMTRYEMMKQDKLQDLINKTQSSDPVRMIDALPKPSRGRYYRGDFYE